MGIRMSGLASGLDTEAIVGALMSAQSLKKTKVQQAKTKLEWKQTKWSELNTKLVALYNNHVSKLQLQSSYQTKKASVSDESVAKVTANNKAANGNYTMEVKNIATSQYLTGAVISAKKGTDKLADLDASLLNQQISVKVGDKTTTFDITADTTVNDFVSKLKGAGLNASFDTDQHRIFISSKDTGLQNAFEITSTAISSAELTGRQNLRDAVGYDKMTKANREIVDKAMKTLQTAAVGDKAYNAALNSLAKAAYETQKSTANTQANKFVAATYYGEKYDDFKSDAETALRSEYYDDSNNLLEGKTEADYKKAVEKKAAEDTTKYVNEKLATDEGKADVAAAVHSGKTAADIASLTAEAKKATGVDANGFAGMNGVDQDSVKAAITSTVDAYVGITGRTEAPAGASALNTLGLAEITIDASGNTIVNGTAYDPDNPAQPNGMALIAASDSKIILNGAELTASSTTLSANGLSIDLVGLTEPGKKITFSVSNDVDAVYDSIKAFLKDYNEVMKEMNTLYSAKSARGYEPLTSEQKESMTDEDIKLWEDKIKDSLLRSDSRLGSVRDSMRNAMMTTTEYNGKKYALSSFGIMTSTNYMEGGMLHIYGDPDDATYADKDDKLKKALAEDPEAVTSVLSDIFTNLRKTMSTQMAGSKYSSALTFYDDIKMKDEIKQYEEDIEEWEDKLASMEDSYYAKFTAMEKALAQLQSQQSSLGMLFGGN